MFNSVSTFLFILQLLLLNQRLEAYVSVVSFVNEILVMIIALLFNLLHAFNF